MCPAPIDGLQDAGAPPRLQGLEPRFPVLRNTEKVEGPVVEVDAAFVVVHLVEREAGELGARRQTRLAALQDQLVALPGEARW